MTTDKSTTELGTYLDLLRHVESRDDALGLLRDVIANETSRALLSDLRLRNAAPELLEALKAFGATTPNHIGLCFDDCERGGLTGHSPACLNAQWAIAKAEGQQVPGPVAQMTNSGEIGTGPYHKKSEVSQ